MLGQDFVLTGYRIFAKFRTPGGRTLRGLRILRSDADRCADGRRRQPARRITTTASATRPSRRRGRQARHRRSARPRGDADVDVDRRSHRATRNFRPRSPFRTLHDARRFAGPLPFTFDYEPQTHSIIAIKGVRENWSPRLVKVDVRAAHRSSTTPKDSAACTPILASAFYVHDIPYRWQRGVRYPPRGDHAAAHRRRRPAVPGRRFRSARFNWPCVRRRSVRHRSRALTLSRSHRPCGWAIAIALSRHRRRGILAPRVAGRLAHRLRPLAAAAWTWIETRSASRRRTWVNLHAGLDESTPALRRAVPGVRRPRVRLLRRRGDDRALDPARPSPRAERNHAREPSISAACRSPTARATRRCCCSARTSCARDMRASRFFAELRRVLAPDGKIILAEHLRDWPNFLAFGPGFLHFIQPPRVARDRRRRGLAQSNASFRSRRSSPSSSSGGRS